MPRTLVFFLKLPKLGEVKTRLARALGDQAALRLYDAFVTDMLGMLTRLVPARAEMIVCASPAERLDECRPWLNARIAPRALPPFILLAQEGRDLGERMRNALAVAFDRGANSAVLLGADLPGLPVDYLDQAFALLDEFDVTLGPTLDGGYCCVGMKPNAFAVEAFEEISWSTPFVLAQTQTRLASAGRSLGLLPAWRDIDEVQDLEAFLATPGIQHAAPATYSAASALLEPNQSL
jgi:rSAM/selenodomain-associated transferase 1